MTADEHDPSALARERFGRFAEGYASNPGHAAGDDLARLVELARPAPDLEVLDVATGGGHTALALAPLVRRVAASDVTPEMLDAARRLGEERGIRNVEYVVAEAAALPFADASFDIVVCRLGAHHFADVPAFVREVFRVLRPCGRFVLEDHETPMDAADAAWIDGFERLRDPSHVRALSALEWRGMLESRGFCIEAVEHFTKTQELARWTALQECAPETVERLAELMREAPPRASAWYRMRHDDGAWTFEIPQVLLAAVRP